MNRGFGTRFQAPRFIQQPAYTDYGPHDDYGNEDEISECALFQGKRHRLNGAVNSSPCPPERSQGGPQYYSQQPAQYALDPIDDYMEDDYYSDHPGQQGYGQYIEPHQMHYQAAPPPQYNPRQQQQQYHASAAYSHQPPAYAPAAGQYHDMVMDYQQEDVIQPLIEEEGETEEPEVSVAQQREIVTQSKGIRLRPVSDLREFFRVCLFVLST